MIGRWTQLVAVNTGLRKAVPPTISTIHAFFHFILRPSSGILFPILTNRKMT
jgi:hypothetical protein